MKELKSNNLYDPELDKSGRVAHCKVYGGSQFMSAARDAIGIIQDNSDLAAVTFEFNFGHGKNRYTVTKGSTYESFAEVLKEEDEKYREASANAKKKCESLPESEKSAKLETEMKKVYETIKELRNKNTLLRDEKRECDDKVRKIQYAIIDEEMKPFFENRVKADDAVIAKIVQQLESEVDQTNSKRFDGEIKSNNLYEPELDKSGRVAHCKVYGGSQFMSAARDAIGIIRDNPDLAAVTFEFNFGRGKNRYTVTKDSTYESFANVLKEEDAKAREASANAKKKCESLPESEKSAKLETAMDKVDKMIRKLRHKYDLLRDKQYECDDKVREAKKNMIEEEMKPFFENRVKADDLAIAESIKKLENEIAQMSLN